MYRVAGLHRLGKFQAVDAEEGDQRVVVDLELEDQAGGNRIHPRPVHDAAAERRGLAVFLVDVQRIVVAR